ncbi:MAG: HEAT repeat domain-containing protein [Gemmatimonadales bacterium]
MRTSILLAATGLALLATPATAHAQSLGERVARAPADQAAAFTFPARSGVCGGSHFVRYGTSVTVSRGSYSYTGTSESHPCESGPVRVTLLRAGTQVVGLEVGVGADDSGRQVADLGAVTGAAAAEYLLGVARTIEGRPGQAAIFPAMLADNVDNTDALLALARNRDLARQTRQSALTWLGREAETLPASRASGVTATLVQIARDESDAPAIRQHAMNVLGRGTPAPGVTVLAELASGADPWLARTATTALASSGDPRARAYLREVARATNRPDGVRAAALRGLGRSYATAQDLALLREIYPTLTTRAERESVLASIGEAGGAENVRWLMSVARDENQEAAAVSRAIRAAAQAGASSTDLAALYDALSSRAPRTTIIGLLSERGDRAAIDKLLTIARSDTDATLRRAAIQRLSSSTDPRVRGALAELVAAR